jgi:hypothetical protein
MELKNFIKETLKDIIVGIQEAQREIEGGIIVPTVNESNYGNVQTGFTSYQKIDFEVTVNAVEQEGSEAKLSIVAAVIGGHVKGDNSNSSGHAAKLKFSIPIKLPAGNKKEK